MDVPDKYIGVEMNGTNCWEFVADYYYWELDIKLRRFTENLKNWEIRRKLEAFLDYYLNDSGWWDAIDKPKYPDIALFDTNGLAIHAGIILDENKMLHMRHSGSLVSKYDDGTIFKERKFKSLVGFYRYKEIIWRNAKREGLQTNDSLLHRQPIGKKPRRSSKETDQKMRRWLTNYIGKPKTD